MKAALTIVATLALTLSSTRHIEWCWTDPTTRLAVIRLEPELYNGTDGACRVAAQIFHDICSRGYNLYVLPSQDGFVPTKYNPVTPEWSGRLLDNPPD